MESDDEPRYDLKALEEDRRRNLEDRLRMLDAYAEWLKVRGVIQGPGKDGATASRGRRPRPAKRKLAGR